MLINLCTLAAAFGGFTLGWTLSPVWQKRVRGGNLGAQRLIWNEGRVIRGNGHGGPLTKKPQIRPGHQPGSGISCSPEVARFMRKQAQHFNDLYDNPQV